MNPMNPGDPFDPMGSARPSSAAPKVLAAIVGFVVLALLVAGALLLVSNRSGDDSGGDDSTAVATDDRSEEPTATTEPAADEPNGEPSETTAAPTTTTAPVAVDLLRTDPKPAVDAWLAAAGEDAVAVEITLYPDYAFLQVRNPDRPRATQDYGWRDGVVEGPEPTTPFPGTDLNAETFPLASVAWSSLPGLVADAPARAGFPRGEVTHVIVTSDAPFSARFIIRIYVTAPSGSDYVVATIDGRPADR